MKDILRKHQQFGWWGVADTLVHRLPVPKRLRFWICDKFDRSLGLYDDDEDEVWYTVGGSD